MISVIMPVFNAEKYLRRALDSILAPGNLEGILEVIAVDDGSTDGSLAILEEYQKTYKQVKVIQSSANGASAARNLGALKARGEYIWFIDADDEISAFGIAALTGVSGDLIMFSAEKRFLDGSTQILSAVLPTEKDFKSRFVRYGMGPWQVVIRRKWYLEHGFKFKEGIIHEDMEMMSSLILYTDKFAAVDQVLYFYYENPESVLHKKRFNKHIFDIFPALEGLYQRFEEAGAAEKYHDELEWFFIWNLLIDSAKDFGKFKEGRPGFERSRKMLKKYFPKWRKNRFLRAKSLRTRLCILKNYFTF